MSKQLEKFGLYEEGTFTLELKASDFENALKKVVLKSISNPFIGMIKDNFNQSNHRFAGKVSNKGFRIRKTTTSLGFFNNTSPVATGHFYEKNNKLMIDVSINGLSTFWLLNSIIIIPLIPFLLITASIKVVIDLSNGEFVYSENYFYMLVILFILSFTLLMTFQLRRNLKLIIKELFNLFHEIENQINQAEL